MKRRRVDRKQADIEALIREIKDVNDAAKFQPDSWSREQLLAEKSTLQSELLREHGECFEIIPEGKGLVGIIGLAETATDDLDACHAVVDRLDPDVRQWVKARLKAR